MNISGFYVIIFRLKKGNMATETELPRERTSIVRRQVFARYESFCALIIFAANGHNFYPAFPENFVI